MDFEKSHTKFGVLLPTHAWVKIVVLWDVMTLIFVHVSSKKMCL